MGEDQGRLLELAVSTVAHGGVMVARHEGRVVFVADAIPGETVRAVVVEDAKPRFWRAVAVEVLEASEHRRPHLWPAASLERSPADRAGGAEFGHIALPHQRELKRRVLAEALERMAGIRREVVVEALPGPEDGSGWRTRLRLHTAPDGTVGPYAARSHRVIRVDGLPLATEALRAVAPIRERMPGAGTIDLVAPAGGEPLILLEGQPAHPITERVGDREFRLEARGFWQVHPHAAATLSAAVQQAVDTSLFDPAAPNLDLYGGVGLLAAALGDRFGRELRVTSVEGDARATAHAARNLAEWPGAEAVTARVDRYLAGLRSGGDGLAGALVVLDPPRSGAGGQVVDRLAELGPAQLIYVACDPVAFARDLARFAEHGYRLRGLRAFDLFPNTHHLEAVASLVKAEA